MSLHDLNRSNDTPIATLQVASVTPKDWPTLPARVPSTARAYTPTITFTGGAEGDDVDEATANSTDAYSPKTQAAKAAAMSPAGSLAVDITTPRGWIDPKSPAKAEPAAPTLTSIAPTTAATGGGTIPVTLTGTGFTRYSTVKTGGVITPYVEYVSPTTLKVILDPRSSAGSIDISVIDHSVETAPQAFTFT